MTIKSSHDPMPKQRPSQGVVKFKFKVKVKVKGQSQRSRSTSTHKSNVKRLSSQHPVKARDDFQINARPKSRRLPSQSQSQSQSQM